MADKLIGLPFLAGVSSLGGNAAGSMGTGNQNDTTMDRSIQNNTNQNQERPTNSRSWWQQAKENLDTFWSDQASREKEKATLIDKQKTTNKEPEEEIKFDQQELMSRRDRTRQRYRPESNNMYNTVFFTSESQNRNTDTVEQNTHQLINSTIESQLLNQTSEPLDQETNPARQQAIQDAQEIANRMTSAMDANEIVDNLINNLEEENWAENRSEEEIEQELITWREIGEFAVALPIPMIVVLYFMLTAKKRKEIKGELAPNENQNADTTEIKAAVEEQEIGEGCRKYEWFDKNGQRQEMIICDNNQMVLPDQPEEAFADFPLDEFGRIAGEMQYAKYKQENPDGTIEMVDKLEEIDENKILKTDQHKTIERADLLQPLRKTHW